MRRWARVLCFAGLFLHTLVVSAETPHYGSTRVASPFSISSEQRGLVLLVEPGPSPSPLDVVLNRTLVTAFRRALNTQYSALTTLFEETANARQFFSEISQMMNTGLIVDAFVIAESSFSADEVRALLPPQTTPGSLNLVVFNREIDSGQRLSWKNAGAQTVLSPAAGDDFGPFSVFAFLQELKGNQAPEKAFVKAQLFSKSWRQLSDYEQRFAGGALSQDESSSQIQRSATLEGFAEKVSHPWLSVIQGVFSGAEQNEILATGDEVRVILGKVIPNLDAYLQEIVGCLESIVVTRKEGRLAVDVLLSGPVTVVLEEEKNVRRGQAYSFSMSERVHFEISMRRDRVVLDRIKGFTAHVKLPVVPDGVAPKKVVLDASREDLTIVAGAVYGLVKVVAHADVRARRFTGIGWIESLLETIPVLKGPLIYVAL